MAFIHQSQFDIHFEFVLGSPECSNQIVLHPCKPGVKGTVIEMTNVPDKCPFEVVEAYGDTSRRYSLELLGPKDFFGRAKRGPGSSILPT